MMGAMVFNSAERTFVSIKHLFEEHSTIAWLNFDVWWFTNKNEAYSDDVCKQIASERFIILPITLPKKSNAWIQIVLAKAL